MSSLLDPNGWGPAMIRRLNGAMASYHDMSFVGLEYLPSEGPALVVATHSAATYDMVITLQAIEMYTGRPASTLVHDLFFALKPVGSWMGSLGGVKAQPGMAQRLLHEGRMVMVLPGGLKEALRPSRTERHRVAWDDRLGFAKLAVQAQVPVICVACGRADDIFDIYGNPLTDLAYRHLRAPLPVFRGWGPTWIPRRVPLVAVFGAPLLPARIHDPSDEVEVESAVWELHRKTLAVVQRLLDASLCYTRGDIGYAELQAAAGRNGKRRVDVRRRPASRAEKQLVVDALSRSAAFRGLDAGAREALASRACLASFEKGQHLLEQGTVPARLHLLVDGEVEVAAGGAMREVLSTLGPGDICGWEVLALRPEQASHIAVSTTRTVTWSLGALEAAFEDYPSLRAQLRTRLSLASRKRELVDLLRRTAIFRGTSPHLVSRLVERAGLAFFPQGDVVIKEGDKGDEAYLVVTGRLIARMQDGGESDAGYERVMGVGDLVGEIALLEERPRSASVVADTDTELLLLSRQLFDSLRRAAPSFEREVQVRSNERLGTRGSLERPVSLVVAVNETRVPSKLLVALLRRALIDVVGDEVATLAVTHRAKPSRRNTITATPCGAHLRATSDGDETVAELRSVARSLNARYVLVYSDRSGDPAMAFWERLLASHAASAVFFTPDAGRKLPFHSHPLGGVICLELLGSPDRRRSLRSGAISVSWRPEFTDADPDLGQLPDDVRAAFARLARAVGQRRVGVALGGGAAWGYAHLALLRGLEEAQIPIDMLAGVSAGSGLAATYASRGLAGLENLVYSNRATQLVLASTVSVSAFRRLVENELDHRMLEELPVPTFPVATEIATGRCKTFRTGSIFEAVRASMCLPPLVTPVFHGDVQYVDGGVGSIVPVNALVEEGADFVIASSVVPALGLTGRRPPQGRLLPLLTSPTDRLRDTLGAIVVAFQLAGAREVNGADVVFAPDLSSFGFGETHKGAAIVAAAERDVPAAIQEIKSRYLGVGLRRTGLGPSPQAAAQH